MSRELARQNPDIDLDDSLPDVEEVDAASVEMMIADNSVGARIRQLRLKRSMGLVELGAKTGLSASFLSQLETGRVVPTLRNLARLGLVFEKDLSYFSSQTSTAFSGFSARRIACAFRSPRR